LTLIKFLSEIFGRNGFIKSTPGVQICSPAAVPAGAEAAVQDRAQEGLPAGGQAGVQACHATGVQGCAPAEVPKCPGGKLPDGAEQKVPIRSQTGKREKVFANPPTNNKGSKIFYTLFAQHP
jgi:hypothetical protein